MPCVLNASRPRKVSTRFAVLRFELADLPIDKGSRIRAPVTIRNCRTGGFAMGTFKRATVSLNSNAVSIIDEVFYAAWDILRSHDPFRELREGSELQISIKQRIFAFATEAVIDSIQLHKQALEGILASNQAVRPSTRLRTPIVPRRMQRVGK